MAHLELYYGAEVFSGAMTAGQRATLDGLLVAMGQANSDDNPRRRNHRRVRLDTLAALYQGAWDETIDLDVAAFKTRLSAVSGIAVGSISHASTTQTFATRASVVVTFSYSSAQRFRVVVFGYTVGNAPTLEQSRVEAAAYLAANSAAWEVAV